MEISSSQQGQCGVRFGFWRDKSRQKDQKMPSILNASVSSENIGGGINFQAEFMGIKNWPKDPARLGLTPKELEKRLNGIEDGLMSPKGMHQTLLDEYDFLQAFAGYPLVIYEMAN